MNKLAVLAALLVAINGQEEEVTVTNTAPCFIMEGEKKEAAWYSGRASTLANGSKSVEIMDLKKEKSPMYPDFMYLVHIGIACEDT